MVHGFRAHGRHQRDSLQPLLEQAFRTLSALTAVVILLALVYAAFYRLGG